MKITVVGLGLIGGSFAKGLRASALVEELLGVDTSPTHAERALELGLVDRIVTLEQAMAESDTVLLAVPVDGIVALLPKLLDAIRDHQTVIDLGSTKVSICDAVRNHPRRSRYVAAHPMAGTEFSGPDAARDGLFHGKTVLLCELERSAPDARACAIAIFEAIGMRIEPMGAALHDRHAAFVSHLSHVVAYALSLAVQSEERAGYAVPRLAGGGFTSTVRLAKSNPEMWVPIFEQNRRELLSAVEALNQQIQRFKVCLEKEDYTCLRDLIHEANRIKELL